MVNFAVKGQTNCQLNMEHGKTDESIVDYVKDRPLISFVTPDQPFYLRWVIATLERFMGWRKVESIYQQVKKKPFSIDGFIKNAFRIANIDHQFDKNQLAKIPETGPLVFVANHPFGVIDGIALCDLAVQTRGEFRILIHSIMCQDKDLARYFLPVDFSNTKKAIKNNIRSKRIAKDSLLTGVPLLVFPSGFVATAGGLGLGKVIESPWTTFAAKMIRDTKATVVPVYFEGQNSRVFHIASHLSDALRSLALLNEVTKRFDKPVHTTIGEPLNWETLNSVGDRKALTQFLYDRVQELKR